MDSRIDPARATARRPLDPVPAARRGPGRRTGHRTVLGRLVCLPRPSGDPPRHSCLDRHRLTRRPTRRPVALARSCSTVTGLRAVIWPAFARCWSAPSRLAWCPRPVGRCGRRRRRRQGPPARSGPCFGRLARRRRTHPRRRRAPRRRPHHSQPRPPSHRRGADHCRPTCRTASDDRTRRDHFNRAHRASRRTRQPQHRDPRPTRRPPRRRARPGPANPRLPQPERPFHHH